MHAPQDTKEQDVNIKLHLHCTLHLSAGPTLCVSTALSILIIPASNRDLDSQRSSFNKKVIRKQEGLSWFGINELITN